ncbi:flagellar basal body rod protein FlgB [Ramlibacter sp.]|uniref:flagellar basal body rod protein FlgB n=1 Tax=Ramlibacter sp. TaxID=1917967 RepID=UPI003D09E212
MSLLTAKIDGHATALDLLAQRQKVLGGNIANADTPGFKARDFDFASALANARSEQQGAGAGMRDAQTAMPELLYRNADQPSLDGNTVELDRERAAFADNAVRYEATLRFINHDVRTLLSAITGQ